MQPCSDAYSNEFSFSSTWENTPFSTSGPWWRAPGAWETRKTYTLGRVVRNCPRWRSHAISIVKEGQSHWEFICLVFRSPPHVWSQTNAIINHSWVPPLSDQTLSIKLGDLWRAGLKVRVEKTSRQLSRHQPSQKYEDLGETPQSLVCDWWFLPLYVQQL